MSDCLWADQIKLQAWLISATGVFFCFFRLFVFSVSQQHERRGLHHLLSMTMYAGLQPPANPRAVERKTRFYLWVLKVQLIKLDPKNFSQNYLIILNTFKSTLYQQLCHRWHVTYVQSIIAIITVIASTLYHNSTMALCQRRHTDHK